MERCVDREAAESGECLYMAANNCVLPKCAFEKTMEEDDPVYYEIETGEEDDGT